MNFQFNNLKKDNNFYLIAEIGVNHECSLKSAKKLILQAKKAGASAAKFQTYKASNLAKINSKAYWNLKKKRQKLNINYFQNTINLTLTNTRF